MYPLKRFVFLVMMLAMSGLSAQNNEKVCGSLDEALKNPGAVVRYYLDCSTGEDSLFFAALPEFDNLRSLTIVGYSRERFPKSLFKARNIGTLCVSECYNLNYLVLFEDLAQSNQLSCLTIDEAELSVIPPRVSSLGNLETLTLTNCDNLDLEQSINSLAKCKNLRNLALPINQISELPENISLLKNLEVLDISNNYIYDFPDGMSGMSQLQGLKAEGNIIINVETAFEKLKSLNIRYLSVDNSISEADREVLTRIFPNARIEYIAADENLFPADSSESATVQQPADSITFGTFRVGRVEDRILSDAYLHFAAVFSSPGLRPDFDSLLFDERFRDTSYSNVYRVPASAMRLRGSTAFDNFRVMMLKKKRNETGKIHFNFYFPNSLKRKLNQEMNAFNGMYWVYDGPLSKRQFRKKFSGSRAKPVEWNDVRVVYHDSDKSFELEFKHRSGYDTLYCYPLLEYNSNPESSKDQYLLRFSRYQKSLEVRRKSFNNRMLKNKAKYNKERGVAMRRAWEDFSRNYMSAEEKKMTRQQWLDYYDNVVGRETEILGMSAVEEKLFRRYLDITKYLQVKLTGQIFDSAARDVEVFFSDARGRNLVVQKVFVFNTLSRLYSVYEGSLGVKPNTVRLGRTASAAMVILLRDGDVAILTNAGYQQINLAQSSAFTLQVAVLDRRLATIAQLVSMAGL